MDMVATGFAQKYHDDKPVKLVWNFLCVMVKDVTLNGLSGRVEDTGVILIRFFSSSLSVNAVKKI